MPKTDYKSFQSLLHQIGYPIAVDGNWGPRSKAALLSFQRAFNPGGGFANGQAPLSADAVPGPASKAALAASAANRGQLSASFHYYEFACGHGGCGACHGWMEVPRAVLRSAEIGRARLFVPHGMGLEVVGGSRCRWRNDNIIKGAKNSQHLHEYGGNALDPHPLFTWQQWRDCDAGVTAMEVRAGSGDACFHIDDRPGSTTSPQVFGWTPRIVAPRDGAYALTGASGLQESLFGGHITTSEQRAC
jgi:hypothetical protein